MNFLKGPKQFIIPIYQRTYSWTLKECGQLANSPLKLNRCLGAIERWDENEIKKRDGILSEQVIKVWAYPQIAEDLLSRYKEKERTKGKEYTLVDHPHLTGPMLELFNQFRKRVLNLDSSVTEEMLKLDIAYKSATNFVDVIPQKNRLRLSINMRFSEIDDPKGFCKDVTNPGRWGNGDVVGISSSAQLDDIMCLVKQSCEKDIDNAI